ncbi:uncharacterized protein N7511_002757 [Penicillium nucicola]|uniref:uncharacterized protein n=1 Tax=Penicillium nucicola TaxID=1850975 RepID=UPI002544E654|nr:uncharacterized protein N7511_002757 [Penicillium nucicola]KAJ5770706.1 hypothetical protein N7511_002757 [Penicillium nucicola]
MDQAGPSELTQAGTERKRTRRACKACHVLKAKCSGALPSCQRCSQKGHECEYESLKPGCGKRKRRSLPPRYHRNHSPLAEEEEEEEASESNTVVSLPPSTTPLTSTESTSRDGETRSQDLSLDLVKELECERTILKPYINAYFEHIAPRPENGFIHRAIFLRAWSSGAVNPTLLKAVCSASAAFVSTETAILKQAEKWRSEVEAYVWANIGRPSMTVLQIIVLLISQNCALFRFLTLQPLLGIAAKMAYMLRLNHENERLSTTAREIRRRIMWSIFIFDRRLAAGQSDLITCPVKSMQIQLPIDEKGFDLAIAGKTGKLIPESGEEDCSTHMGTRAYFCRLSHIRHEILA